MADLTNESVFPQNPWYHVRHI